jgi:DeoR family glycerol-3-phosphate regulon repressor
MLMGLSERQTKIAGMVHENDFISVEHLADHFKVTIQTIRRDINHLCDRGIARRRHGGVERPVRTGNEAYGWRQLNADAKKMIAREVARYVPNRVSLAFSIGTTPEIVAEALLAHDQLRILANNLNVAMLACTNPSFEVTVDSSRLRNDDRDVLGPGMEALFSAQKVDIGIFGVAGVDEDGTLLDFYEEEVRVRQIIRENSRASFLVVDSTKFGRTAHVRGGKIEEATKIFCERRPPEKIVDRLKQSDAELVICGGAIPHESY